MIEVFASRAGGTGDAPPMALLSNSITAAASARDGNLMMFIYLPIALGEAFIPYIEYAIVPLLRGLADENEFVRDTAMLCGQRIVNGYASNAVELLLPQLEAGLFDENWRIRYCSVKLLGDLLYVLTGTSGKKSTEGATDEESFGSLSHLVTLERTLCGRERRDRVVAELYISRSDVAYQVRQVSIL